MLRSLSTAHWPNLLVQQEVGVVTSFFHFRWSLISSNLTDKQPIERVKAFESTPLFASIHSETAAGGQTAPPSNTYTELHFTCFVAAPDASYRDYAKRVTAGETEIREPSTDGTGLRIVELDGSRSGPIDRGPIKNDFLTVCSNLSPRTQFI